MLTHMPKLEEAAIAKSFDAPARERVAFVRLRGLFHTILSGSKLTMTCSANAGRWVRR